MDRPTLSETLDAVAQQTCQDIEVVVVNARGGAHATLPESCGRFPLRLINVDGPHLSRPAAANALLDAAQGAWLIFLDDDDSMDPDHLERLISTARQVPGREVVYTGIRVMDAEGLLVRHLSESFDRIRLWQTNFLPIHAVLFARSVLDKGCRFDEELVLYEDWDFWVQLAFHTDFVKVDGISATYRLVGDSGLSAGVDNLVVQQGRTKFYEKWRSQIPASELACALARAEEARTLEQQLKEAKSTYRVLEAHCRTLEADLQMQQATFSDLENSYRTLENGYNQVMSSVCWRWTEPLRIGHKKFIGVLRAAYHAIPVSDERRLRWRYRLMQALPGKSVRSSSATPSFNKETVRAAAETELDEFIDSGLSLSLPLATPPRVSVLLVLFNQAGLTYGCLKALSQAHGASFETIIVDNASSDRTGELLDRLTGATIIRNTDNEGFLLAVNRAAEVARGEFLLLLNNDAVMQPDALAAAVRRMDSTPDAGAVGGAIVLWDGNLQEAGSIIWRDGSCLGYGRGDDPAAPAYAFVRDVDYCSGAFLLIRRALFEGLGRFDIDYAPAYYEESDFCVRLWENGYRVIYDPAVRIQHFEFASTGERSEQAIALQVRNRERFVAKHQGFLNQQPAPSIAEVLVARQRHAPGKQRILFIDDRAPQRDLGSGFPRAQEFIRTLVDEGHFITHYPLRFPRDPWDKVRSAVPEGVEIMQGHGVAGLPLFLAERKGYYDSIIVSRPHNMVAFNAVYEGHPEWFDNTLLIYDAEALFSLRDITKAAVLDQGIPPVEQDKMIFAELAIARNAQRIVTVSTLEAGYYRRRLNAEVYVLGHTQSVCRDRSGFDGRHGYLFVGAVDGADSPNGDSLIWFLREVWPHITARGDARLHVVGMCNSPEVRQLSMSGVYLHGQVPLVDPFYDTARVFIIPTRFAAGIPHKAHEAAAYGVPMVVTPLIAGQLGWNTEVETADSSEAFAAACIALHDDPARWKARRDAAWDAIERDCSPRAFRATVAQIVAAGPVGKS